MPHPLRLLLVNLCEDAAGFGPAASEYLRAHVLSRPRLRERVEVDIAFLEGTDPRAFADETLRRLPDVLGFTCYSWNLHASGETARVLRLRGFQGPIVWGGVSFALLRQRHDWFRWWDVVDAVALGSGEATLEDLLDHLLAAPQPMRAIPPLDGLAVPGPDGPCFGRPRAPILDLDSLASPYSTGALYQVPHPYVEMARGCPLSCTFCSDARESREGLWRERGVEALARELAAIVEWPVARRVDAGSSTANVSAWHFASVCEAIRRGDPGQRLEYSFQLHPGLVRPSQREALNGVRVGKLYLGLQSNTPRTWRLIRRRTTLEQVRRASALLAEVGPCVVSVILGLPGETRAEFLETLDALLAMGTCSVAVHRLLLLPGTQLHRDAGRLGLEFSEERFYRVTSTPEMPADELSRAQQDVAERARALPHGVAGRPNRLDWTNFDEQARAFTSAEAGRAGREGG